MGERERNSRATRQWPGLKSRDEAVAVAVVVVVVSPE